MNILFVSMLSFSSNSSATISNKGIIKGLYELGHTVDTLTLEVDENSINYDPSINSIKNYVDVEYYIPMNNFYKLFMNRKSSTDVDTNKTNKNQSILGRCKNFVRNTVKKLYDDVFIYDPQKCNVKNVDKVRIDYSKYDIIISGSDPKSSHLIAKRIFDKNRNLKSKWIQLWGDPMFDDITRNKKYLDYRVKEEEKKLLSICDEVVYVSPLTLDRQKKLFEEYAHKMKFITHCCYDDINVNNGVVNFTKHSEKMVVGYFGAYNSAFRDIMPLYNVFKDNKSYDLDIAGSSDLKLDNDTNISVYKKMNSNEVKSFEEKCDILVCICNKYGSQIPAKIYYCTAYNKPIIVIVDGEEKEKLRSHFDEFDRFIICDNDEESIEAALVKAAAEVDKNYSMPYMLTCSFISSKLI